MNAALGDYEAALTLDEDVAEAYLGIADVYIRRGDLAKAEEILTRGLEITGNDGIARKLAELRGENVRDSDGVTRIRRYYDADGTLTMYTYSHAIQEDGTKRMDEYSADGRLQSYHISYESEDGLTMYSDRYEPDGRLSDSSVRVEDSSGKWLYSLSGQDTDHESRHEAVYSETGEPIGWDSYNNGVLESWARYEDGKTVYYDADGNMTGYGD
jgi:tetratricopeptide (TPR) repeat protein